MSEVEAQDESELESTPSRGPFRIIALVIALIVLGAGGWWGYTYYEAQKAERAQAEARAAAQQKAAQASKRAAEDAKMAEDLQRQKVAADEAVRRAQEDRDRAAHELELAQAQARPKGGKRAK
jgi:predicted negative regulator of RcsB-dependent stress response